jgi:hypothetical protein
MDCPQCGAGVPADDLFCGKCGYAMRDQGPQRVDQSRIRVHEEPQPAAQEPPTGRGSQQRVRKHTVMGMPLATPPTGSPTPPPEASPPSPPTEISTARSRARARTPQKTMLGIPRPDFPAPPGTPEPEEPADAEQSADVPIERFAPPKEASSPSHRARARVRYDSANEPFPVVQRRKNVLRGLALAVLLSGAWLAYRYLTLHG